VDRLRLNRVILNLALLLSTGSAVGCDLFGDDTSLYVVRVDSVSAPLTIASDQPLEIVFHGLVGFDGCSRLSEVEKESGPGHLRVRFVAERRSGECTQMPVPLNHVETVPPPLQNPFTITVIQPSGPPLDHVVQVQ
jgi:hypothetical protein